MLRTDYEIRDALERLPSEEEFQELQAVHERFSGMQRAFGEGVKYLDAKIRSLHAVRLPRSHNSFQCKERVYNDVLARLTSILELCKSLEPVGKELAAADVILSRHGHGSRRLSECYALVNTVQRARLEDLGESPLPADVMRHVFMAAEYDGTQLAHPVELCSAFGTLEPGREQFGVLVRHTGGTLQVIEHPEFRNTSLVERAYARRSFALPGGFGKEQQRVLCKVLPDELVTYLYGRPFADFPPAAQFAEIELPRDDGDFYVLRRAPCKSRGLFDMDVGFVDQGLCDGKRVNIKELGIEWGEKGTCKGATWCAESLLYEQAQMLMGGPFANALEILECGDRPTPSLFWTDVVMLFDPASTHATLFRDVAGVYFNGRHYDCKDMPLGRHSLESICLSEEHCSFRIGRHSTRVFTLEPANEVLDFLSEGKGKRLAKHGVLNRVEFEREVLGPAILPLAVNSTLRSYLGRENVKAPELGRDMYVDPVLLAETAAGGICIKKKKGLLGRLF